MLSLIYVTGFAKTIPKGTRDEIQITASCILKLHSSTIQTHQVYGCRWPGLLLQAAFFRPCQPTRVCYRASGATEEDCSYVVPDCCQRPSGPILCIVADCWRHSTAVCVLMEGINLPSASHPPQCRLLPPSHPYTRYP